MINSYNDYLLIEHFKHDTKFQVLNEKNLSSDIDKDIKFAVIMPTFRLKTDGEVHTARAKYSESIDLLKDAIGSLKGQSYKNWKLYLIGDAYEDDQEVKDLLSSMLKPDQYTYHNLSSPGERNDNITSEELWMTGGTAACNKGLSLADKDGMKYITRLDHDDKWKANHLELLAKAYTQYPNLGFAFTQARKKVDAPSSNKKYMFMPEETITLDADNKGYVAGQTAHATVSWRPDLIGKFKYRDAKAQKGTEPKNSKTLGGDVDMFRRIMDKIKSSDDLQYMFIPTLTTYIRNRKGKF
jgi:hypothetical protein